jgi:hypothetical protein
MKHISRKWTAYCCCHVVCRPAARPTAAKADRQRLLCQVAQQQGELQPWLMSKLVNQDSTCTPEIARLMATSLVDVIHLSR